MTGFKFSMLEMFTVLLFVGACSMPSVADESDWSNADIQPLTTELVMELKVSIGPTVEIGPSDKGTRRYISITGGSFEGKGIKGEVLAGGADWQLTRPDGVLEVNAIYAIKTHDGAVITVTNSGLVDVSASSRYVRTVPSFQAPNGKYDWLNRRVFVGTITPSPKRDFVTIRVFEVR
jgi:hypothetical protein